MTTILVVDDDDSVRAMLARLLRTAGYDVLQAKSGITAREVLETRQAEIVVSDIVMPGDSGIELRRWLSTNRPELPVILTSGYSPDAPAEFAARIPRTWFLQKPFGADVLLKLIHEVLHGRPQGDSAPV